MSEALEKAKADLLAAQQKILALSQVPEDTFAVGTVIRWRLINQGGTFVSLKVGSDRWLTTGFGSGTYPTWDSLTRCYFSQGLDLFEVAEKWRDVRVNAEGRE